MLGRQACVGRLVQVVASKPGVLRDIDVPSADEALTKAELAARIAEIIAKRKLTQAAAGEILGVDQPKAAA